MIVSLIFDLGISNQPVALAKIEHPMVLDASKRRRGMVIREQKHDDPFVHPAAVLKFGASTPRLFFCGAISCVWRPRRSIRTNRPHALCNVADLVELAVARG
jgi:hypothetical protein